MMDALTISALVVSAAVIFVVARLCAKSGCGRKC